MDEVTLNTATTLPVILTDVNRDPVTGVVFGGVTCKYSKAGAALGTLAVTADNWTEIGREMGLCVKGGRPVVWMRACMWLVVLWG